MDNDATGDLTTQNSSADDPLRWLAGRLRWEQYLAHAHAVWMADHRRTPQRQPSPSGALANHRPQALPPQPTTSHTAVHTAPSADHAAASGTNHQDEPSLMLNEGAIAVIAADLTAEVERAAASRRGTPPHESAGYRTRRTWRLGLRLPSRPAKRA